jgi:hypothetical protein
MRSEKVPESPSSALQDGFPLNPGRKGGAAPATQPGIQHRLHDGLRSHRQRTAQPLVAILRDVVGNARRIDDTDAREGQTLLAREPRQRIDESERQGVVPTV